MSETVIVEIPTDVKDNSSHTVRFQWRGVVTEELTDHDLKLARTTYGYTVYRWDDEAPDGQRVTLTRMDDAEGRNVWFYGTYYYTRVACTDCEHRYAQSYIAVTDWDGVTHPAAPFCGTHGDVVKRITDKQRGHSWHESEPLRIGQHD